MHTDPPIIIELRTGLWMVKTQGEGDAVGVIRGYLQSIDVKGEPRFLARLPHLNPTQGLRVGEYWEWQRAVDAILAERPRRLTPNPFGDEHYSTREEREGRLETARQRRRFAGRFTD